jgi:hypothetical protein
MINESSSKQADRVGGALLIAAAAGTILAMAHHPSGAHGGAIGGIVHGAMIALLALMTWGFALFALSLGGHRPLVLGGMIAYAIALFGHIGAATINGFVVPALAARGGVGHDFFLLAWEANQALARLGVVAAGIAYLLWSAQLLGRGGLARWLGLVGLVAGLVPIVLLTSGAIRLDVAGAFLVYALQGAWAAMVGAALLSGRLFDAPQRAG